MIEVRPGVTVLLGGARSGKSDLAVRLGESWPGAVAFVATATAGDADMAQRITRHQDERPPEWGLVEAPRFSAATLTEADAEALIIVDCITLLVANLLFADHTDEQVASHINTLAAAAADRRAPTLIVTNEVGLGVHPETELGRRYRDLLGRANRQLVAASEQALFVVAGRAIPLQEVSLTW